MGKNFYQTLRNDGNVSRLARDNKKSISGARFHSADTNQHHIGTGAVYFDMRKAM